MRPVDAESAPDEAAEETSAMFPPMFDYAPAISLEEALKQIDESFSEMLLRKIVSRNDRGRMLQEGECGQEAFFKNSFVRLYNPQKQ